MTVEGKQGLRTIPLDDALVRALQEYGLGPPGSRVLRCAYSTARSIYDRLKAACRRAGVQRFAPGALRRLAVDSLYESAADPAVAGAVVGHSPVVAMRHYRQVQAKKSRAAMENARLTDLPGMDGLGFAPRDPAPGSAGGGRTAAEPAGLPEVERPAFVSPAPVEQPRAPELAELEAPTEASRHNSRHNSEPSQENADGTYFTRYPPISLLKIHATTSPISNPAAM